MKIFWKYLILILVTAGIVGGLTYYFVNKKATADKNNLQSQINDLNTKYIAALKSLTAAKATTSTTTSSTTASSSTATTPATTSAAPAAASWKSYTNADYGFSFTFPNDAWKNFVAAPVTPSDGSATKYIYYCVPTTDTSWADSCAKGKAAPVSIGVYTVAQWNTIKDDGSPESLSDVAQNSTYVFTFSTWQATPSDLANTNFDTKSISSSLKAN